ncbi:hypothetical protein ACFE04_000888 [Oxalis oulophora]
MAKVVILLASAVCFLSLIGFTHCTDAHFFIEGQVYCDTCNIEFVTRVSKFISGATVRLECKDREGGTLTYSAEDKTDEKGVYRIKVEGDHEEEVCEILLVKSSMPDCQEISTDNFLKNGARISLAANNGMADPVRNANPLGFMVKTPLPECPEVLKELGITATGDLI